jgi:hypothetical protein
MPKLMQIQRNNKKYCEKSGGRIELSNKIQFKVNHAFHVVSP